MGLPEDRHVLQGDWQDVVIGPEEAVRPPAVYEHEDHEKDMLGGIQLDARGDYAAADLQ